MTTAPKAPDGPRKDISAARDTAMILLKVKLPPAHKLAAIHVTTQGEFAFFVMPPRQGLEDLETLRNVLAGTKCQRDRNLDTIPRTQPNMMSPLHDMKSWVQRSGFFENSSDPASSQDPSGAPGKRDPTEMPCRLLVLDEDLPACRGKAEQHPGVVKDWKFGPLGFTTPHTAKK